MEAELVWTRATEVKWKHMAGLGSNSGSLFSGCVWSREWKSQENTSLWCLSNLVNGRGLRWGGLKACVHVMPLWVETPRRHGTQTRFGRLQQGKCYGRRLHETIRWEQDSTPASKRHQGKGDQAEKNKSLGQEAQKKNRVCVLAIVKVNSSVR